MTPEQVIYDFLTAYIVYVESDGFDNEHGFSRDDGLCDNLYDFTHYEPGDSMIDNWHTVKEVFENILPYGPPTPIRITEVEGTSLSLYPFNNGSRREYLREEVKYKNAARMQWVREKHKELANAA